MSCVTTVNYSVLLNGQSFGFIAPERGLRQGDPISLFLFVLCAEGLSYLLNQKAEHGLISGIQFSPSGPALHHLFFADDSLFLFKADISQYQYFQEVLQKYGEATGQVINFSKSSLTFGKKVDHDLKLRIQTLLGIFEEGGASTYLGLPKCFSGSKVKMLEYIQEKMKGRMSCWYSRFLSQAGKEIIIKSIALAMPIYAMSCFKFPKTTCRNLTSAMASFGGTLQRTKGRFIG